jgi:drug/metabolite transporter (DMT)-like permease
MGISTVIKSVPGTRLRRLDLRVLLAFTAIYVLWGATFLAIRIAVLEVPPFFSSGVRFFIAGALVCIHASARTAQSFGHPVAQHRNHRGVHVRGDLWSALLG